MEYTDTYITLHEQLSENDRNIYAVTKKEALDAGTFLHLIVTLCACRRGRCS
jgi:hypothetical protein